VPAGTRAAPRVAFDPPSLSGDRAAAMPTIVWGLLVAIAGIAIWQLSRRWRRWWAYLLGAPVFVVLLFIFFENIARLLPANI
jgi:chromate transport protein ChrA